MGTHRSASDPQPIPWRSESSASIANRMVLAVAAKVTGEVLIKKGHKAVGGQLSSSANAALDDLLDQCGTPYPGWPFPGPPPWIFEIMTEVTLRAGTMQGEMHVALGQLNEQITSKAFGQKEV